MWLTNRCNERQRAIAVTIGALGGHRRLYVSDFLFIADPRGISEILRLPLHAGLCLFAIVRLVGWIP